MSQLICTVSVCMLQTLSLMRHRLADSIHIEEYTVGRCLLISYWRFASLLSLQRGFVVSHTHTHLFNGPFSGTTRVSQHQKGNTNLDFTEARDSEWQWHQLGHMQVCTSLLTDNHASTQPPSFYRSDAHPAAQPTVSEH